MTISSSTSTVTRNGNGVATSFSFPFKVWAASQLQVYLRNPAGEATLTTDWEATLSDPGGSVTYPKVGTTKLPAGWQIVILRNMPFTQEADYVNATPFLAENVETTLDMLTASCQQLKEQVDRAVKIDPGSTNPEAYMQEIRAAVASTSADAETCEDDAAATAADRVQTGLDRAAAAADKAAVAADKATVAADKATVAADKASTSGFKDTAVSSASTATTKASEAAASASSATASASSAAASASTATTKASEAAASASSATASASTATTKASEAAASASTATTKASEAAASATSASTSLAAMRSIVSFGAVGNGVADDTPAFVAAAAVGGAFFVPAGTYRLTAAVSILEKDFALHGAGPRLSMLVWESDLGGFNIVQNDSEDIDTSTVVYYQTELRDLSLLTTAGSGATGWAVDVYKDWRAVHYGRNRKTFQMTNVEIAGVDPRAHGWANGVRVTNANYCEFRNVMVTGRQDASAGSTNPGFYYNMNLGIYLTVTDDYVDPITGDIVAHEGNGMIFDGCRFKNCAYPIRCYGPGEGVIISNTVVALCYVGFHVERKYNGTQVKDPMLFVSNCHVNAVYRSIYAKWVLEAIFRNNLLYSFPYLNASAGDGTENAYTGIYLEEVNYSIVSGNTIEGYRDARSDTLRGIVLNNCQYCEVSDNLSINADVPVLLCGGSQFNTIRGNHRAPNSDTTDILVFDGANAYLNNIGPQTTTSTADITVTGTLGTLLVAPHYYSGGHKYKITCQALVTTSVGSANQVRMSFTKIAGTGAITADTPASVILGPLTPGTTASTAQAGYYVAFESIIHASTPGGCNLALQMMTISGGTSVTVPAGKAFMTIERID